MNKLDPRLAAKILADPGANFFVIILLEKAMDPDALPFGPYEKLMDNILSATLSGKDILQLAEDINIRSIQEDQEIKFG